MKIVVCAKIIDGEINPFDACALECALSVYGAEVTLLTMGPESTVEPLMRLSRLDVARVILLSDSVLAGSDTLVTGRALAAAIRQIRPDYVMCGRQSIDGDTAQVGPIISEMLGYGLITNILKIKSITDTVECETRLGSETVKAPAVLTVERINTLRFARMRSAVKEIEIKKAADLGLEKDMCGLAASPTRVLKSFESSRGSRKCRFITLDELDKIVYEALQKTYNWEKCEEAEAKLDSVAVIGEELYDTALSIAQHVRIVEETDAEKIAVAVKDEQVVLWKADLWGRRTAPLVAAKLQTGLCADCTRLETDGRKLYIYRPAYGGRLTAKIECRTNPQMATVRIRDKQSDGVVLAVGRGAVEDIEKYERLAQRYKAEIAASRAAVDMNAQPYERQVGLTGRSVSPKVYIACGISGAVQHTCAIEGAGTVIAINPDKNARIFEYSDYGIISKL